MSTIFGCATTKRAQTVLRQRWVSLISPLPRPGLTHRAGATLNARTPPLLRMVSQACCQSWSTARRVLLSSRLAGGRRPCTCVSSTGARRGRPWPADKPAEPPHAVHCASRCRLDDLCLYASSVNPPFPLLCDLRLLSRPCAPPVGGRSLAAGSTPSGYASCHWRTSARTSGGTSAG